MHILNQQQNDVTHKKINHHFNIKVTKPYEHKQIDTRWIELKLTGNFISRSYFANVIQAGKAYIHGGYNEQQGILSDMYYAQFYSLPTQWNQIIPKSNKTKNPPPLRNHTLCAYKSYLILFGGQKNMLENNNKIYRFDLRTNEWEILKVKFTNNQQIVTGIDSQTATIINENMYVFGGYNSQNGLYSNSLLKLNLIHIAQGIVEISEIHSDVKPPARGNFSSCVCQQQLYIFGGTNSNDIYQDFWVFDVEKNLWKQIDQAEGTNTTWPQKRKGQIMVHHLKSNSIFMFGGIKQITKEKNDIMIYLVPKQKWVRIHKKTDQLYEPSPTLKIQTQTSPSVIEAKQKKMNQRSNCKQDYTSFGISLNPISSKNRTITEGFTKQKSSNKINYYQPMKTEITIFSNSDSANKKRINFMQQQKYRQFYNRKKKLLDQIHKNSKSMNSVKRAHSPTSETLIYSIGVIGQQKKMNNSTEEELPKVIFDQQKGVLIGKKPCARDGHAGLVHEQNIIIIGGDRHMISFKDVYIFKMDKAIQNIYLYE